MLLIVGAVRVANVSDEAEIRYVDVFQFRAEVVLLAAMKSVGV